MSAPFNDPSPFGRALAALAAHEEPTGPGATPEMIAAAQILRGVWLALHRGDEPTLHDWAAGPVGYLRARPLDAGETTVCRLFPLPPIKSLTRAEAVGTLFQLTKYALGRHGAEAGYELAESMHIAIAETFPNLLPSVFPRMQEPTEKIHQAIERDIKLYRVSVRRLVMSTLQALGMPDTEIASTLKSVGE